MLGMDNADIKAVQVGEMKSSPRMKASVIME
jgi:hypothetical protein